MNRIAFGKLHSSDSHRSSAASNAKEVFLNTNDFPALSASAIIDSSNQATKKSLETACHSYSDKLRNTRTEHNFASSNHEHQDFSVCNKKVQIPEDKQPILQSHHKVFQGDNNNIQKLQNNSLSKAVPYFKKYHHAHGQNRNFGSSSSSEKLISHSAESSIFMSGSKVQTSHIKQNKLLSENLLLDNSSSRATSDRKSNESGAQITAVYKQSATTGKKDLQQENSGEQQKFVREINKSNMSNKWQLFQRSKNSLRYKQDKLDASVCGKNEQLKSSIVSQHQHGNLNVNLRSRNCASARMNTKQQAYTGSSAISYPLCEESSPNHFHVVERRIQPSSNTAVTKQFRGGIASHSNARINGFSTKSNTFCSAERNAAFPKNERTKPKKAGIETKSSMMENSHMSQNTDENKQKRRRKRPSKVKRQTAFQTGKLLILTPELHQRITNQLSENVPRPQATQNNVFCDINNATDYPELGLSSGAKHMNSKQVVCSQPAVKFDSEMDNRVLKSDEKAVAGNSKKLAIEKSKKLEEQDFSAKDKSETCRKNEDFKVKACPRDPVQLFEILSTTQTQVKQPKIKTEHAAKVVSTKRSKLNRNLHAPNVLDSSAPVKRGKEREKPKQKRKTPLKKIILLEREQKKNKNLESSKGNGLEASIAEGSEECKKETHHSECETNIYAEQGYSLTTVRSSGALLEDSGYGLQLNLQADYGENYTTVNSFTVPLTEAEDINVLLDNNEDSVYLLSDRQVVKQSNDLEMTGKFKNFECDKVNHEEFLKKFSTLHIAKHNKPYNFGNSFEDINDTVLSSNTQSCDNVTEKTRVRSQNVSKQIIQYANIIAEKILRDCIDVVLKIVIHAEERNCQSSPATKNDTIDCNLENSHGCQKLAITKMQSAVSSDGITQSFQLSAVGDKILNPNCVYDNEIVLHHDNHLSLGPDNYLVSKENAQETNSEVFTEIISQHHNRNAAVESISKIKEKMYNQKIDRNLHIKNTSSVCKEHAQSLEITSCHNKGEAETRSHAPINEMSALHFEEIQSCDLLEKTQNEDERNRLKAVQVILHTKNFREYCHHLLSKELDESVLLLLSDLYRFQDRLYQKDPVKAHMKRRLVYGIKEVTKHMKLKKLKCVIIAPNLEDIKTEGGLNDALANLIRLSYEYHVPCIFAADRKQLGKISHKSVPVSCIGIFSYDGSEMHFKKIKDFVEESMKDYKDISIILQDNLLPNDVKDLLNAAENAPQTLLNVRTRILQSIAVQLQIAKNEEALSNFEKCRQKYIMRI